MKSNLVLLAPGLIFVASCAAPSLPSNVGEDRRAEASSVTASQPPEDRFNWSFRAGTTAETTIMQAPQRTTLDLCSDAPVRLTVKRDCNLQAETVDVPRCANLQATSVSIELQHNQGRRLSGYVSYPLSDRWPDFDDNQQQTWEYFGGDKQLVIKSDVHAIRVCVQKPGTSLNLDIKGESCTERGYPGVQRITVTGPGCADFRAREVLIPERANPEKSSWGHYIVKDRDRPQ